ncbi:hypothetical protein [Dechloromonas sp. H13]|uniref:hypothetical protein n=1 Tax=Dechloromonas sp. H13 TaxID=2570193 RepID=UPI00129202E9|nr:hypothetical protein [Dechloromonas sp. H13]
MRRFAFSADAFGDRFDLADLPLPRPPRGYAVQMLDTDTLLDRHTGAFLPVRASGLAGLFATFDEAYAAACRWVEAHCATPQEHRLAIVPAGFDDLLQRHVLIYGVLCCRP